MPRNPANSENSNSSNIIWLQDAHPKQLTEIGFKALNLAIAMRLKAPVLPGFVISTSAYAQSLAQTGMDFSNWSAQPYEEAIQSARTVQHYLFKQDIPSDVLTDIRQAYKQLMEVHDGPVVVRPSVVYTNGVDFAKRLRPILGVKSLIELEKAIKMAWAYMWLDDIIHYRFSHPHLLQNCADLALVLQPLQAPYVSGSLLSYDPGQDDQFLVIESARGLNEAVSRGVIVPDSYCWQRFLKKVQHQKIANKPLRFVLADQWAIQEVSIEQSQRDQPSLNAADLSALAEIAEKLTSGYKRALEVEWFKTPQGFQILQVMPIKQPDFQAVRAENWQELNQVLPYFNKPLSPLGWSLLQPLFQKSLVAVFDTLGIEANLPDPAFQQHDYQLTLHPDILPLLRKAFEQYWAEIAEDSPYKRYLLFLKALYPLQRLWSKAYRQASEFLEQEWQHEYDGWGAEDLLLKLEEVNQTGETLFQSLVLVRILNYLVSVLFADFAQNYLPAEQVYDILYRGLPGRYANSAQLIERYIQDIQQHPDWVKLFRSENSNQITNELHLHETGKTWLKQLMVDFSEYGFFRLSLEPLYPSWVEAPQILIKELSHAIKHQQTYWNPQEEVQRQELEQRLLEGFNWAQLPQRFFYQTLLNLSQNYATQVEEEPFYLAMWTPRVRSLVLALARYLPLDSKQDIFYLTLTEIQEMIQNPMNAYKIKALRELIQARKYKRKITHRLGPDATGDLQALELTGFAASQGEALGRVRVITRSEDLKALQPDEIIVTDYFEPFWEQSLEKAGGLILELGGVLSHGAMLARHYQIPAIAAVPKATQRLKTGLIARIDGFEGRIMAYQEAVLDAAEDWG